jgi:hypothetical protein
MWSPILGQHRPPQGPCTAELGKNLLIALLAATGRCLTNTYSGLCLRQHEKIYG